MNDTSPESGRDPVEQLLESFLARWRRGERPSPEEYAARCPERADEIHELFPALVEMEQLKPAVEAATGLWERLLPRPESASGPATTNPERLGDFKILRVIGEGGMGVVYEAEHESLKNRVALKVMHARFRTERAYLRRFRTEARSAARLHHTNIVPVFDFGEQDGICYYAMQYIAGVGLNDVLEDVRRLRAAADGASQVGMGEKGDDRPTEPVDAPVSAVTRGLMTGRFATAPATPAGSAPPPTGSLDSERTDQAAFVVAPSQPAPAPSTAVHNGVSGSSSFAGQPESTYFREIARLGAQVADALDYAHHQGVVHRDIKPSNLMLDAQGSVWVTDFGLAKLVEGDDLSQSRDVVGTLRFMAPERFRGITDRRGDIYALGATLYEMLALRPAFAERDQARLIDQIAHQAPVPLRQHDRRIPRDLETIVLKVLSKEPKDRCDKSGELRDELQRFLEGRPTRWRRVGPVEQFRRWCKRNPMVAGLNALAATLTILVAIVSTIAAYLNGRLAQELKGQRDEASRNLVQAKQNLIQSYTTEAEARRQSRRVGQRFKTLDAIERAMELASTFGITEAQRFRLRNEAIAALALPDLPVARELDVPRAAQNGFTVDPAFERYAFKRDDGTVVVRRLADDAELFRLPGLPPDGTNMKAAFNSDGRFLAMEGESKCTLQVFDLEGRRQALSIPGVSAGNPPTWAFHPEGREVVIGLADGSIVFHELPVGREVRQWARKVHNRVGAIAYSPDGTWLAIVPAYSTAVFLRDPHSGRVLGELPHPNHVFHLAWNPRRPNLLAVTCEDSAIYIWDVNTGKQTMTLKGETYNGLVIAYHPNGELLASRGWHNVLRLWDTRTGRMVLSQPSAWSPTLEFDQTGRWLSVDASQEKARILEVADAAEGRTLVREPFREDDRHIALAIDPAGRRAVTTGSPFTVWDLPTGATLATLPVRGDQQFVLFDASGAVLTEFPALLRWPVTEAPNGAATIGPPQMLQPRGTTVGFAITPDGRTIAAAMYDDGGLVFDAQNPQHARWVRPHRDVRRIAVSPDARWVVTGSHGVPEGMKLWDAQTGRLIHDFPGVPNKIGGVWSFSPDGRWLAVDWDGWVLFETTTWTPKVRLFRGLCRCLAFAPDSRTAVYGDNAGTLILAELETGRELARLEDPEQARLNFVAFTPDGSRLVTTLADRPYLRVWDLRAIRRRLAELRLDWDPPAIFATPDAPGSFPPTPKPFRVDRGRLDSWLKRLAETPAQTVERTTRAIEANPDDAKAHHERAHALTSLKRLDEAITDFTAALKARPNDAHLLASRGSAEVRLNRLEEALGDCEAALRQKLDQADRETLALLCNNLAWTLATGPAPTRDPARALSLARHAVELTPDRAIYLNTLGVAQYRASWYAESVNTLERSLGAGKGETDAFDLFFLAMARYKLGQIARARADFDRAVQWRHDHPNQPAQWSTELDAFQAEVQALLDGPPFELPADVFAPSPRSDRESSSG
jgi:serine/threonine protein kinase/WD40 repeat protein/Tfp pilus assembly protein PilF